MTDTPSKDDLKSRLTPEQFAIAYGEGTERPFSNPLNTEKRSGLYKCVGCGETLFVSENKYDSGSGWPSFDRPASADALASKTDFKIGAARVEVHCAKCGSHMGHVFPDGPVDTTGQRFCINGSVLTFVPTDES